MPYYSILTQSRELIRGKIKYVVATNKKDCMFFSDKLKAMKKQKKIEHEDEKNNKDVTFLILFDSV